MVANAPLHTYWVSAASVGTPTNLGTALVLNQNDFFEKSLDVVAKVISSGLTVWQAVVLERANNCLLVLSELVVTTL